MIGASIARQSLLHSTRSAPVLRPTGALRWLSSRKASSSRTEPSLTPTGQKGRNLPHSTGPAGSFPQKPSSRAAPTSASASSETAARPTSDDLSTLDSAAPQSHEAANARTGGTFQPNSPGLGALPDLRQGIPSTFAGHNAYSQTGNRSSGDGYEEESAGLPTITGGKGGKELPGAAYISSIERRKRRLARLVFSALLLMSVSGTVYLGRNWESAEEEEKHPEAPSGWGIKLFYNRLRARWSDTMNFFTEPAFPKLLPDPDPALARPFTLVLSLEDLLVHSEWSREHGWRLAKRPGVDYFIRYLSQYYELVIFTSSPMVMAEPIIRKLDPYRIIMWPLFREATKYVEGHQVKDLSYLNRDLSRVIMIETDPANAQLQPENTIILPKWTGDPKDRELVALIPFLEYIATMGLTDTRLVLKSFEGKHIPTEFSAREAVARRKFEEQMAQERAKRTHRLGKGLLDSVMGHRGGGGLDGFEQSAAEAFEQGKMLQDIIRERGQKQYEALEKEIRENGEAWLKEMAAEDEKMAAEQLKGMRSGMTDFIAGILGGGGKKSPTEES